MKPTIRRSRTTTGALAPGWVLTRPGYGFITTSTTTYDSWLTAHNALRPTLGTASPSTERQVASYTPGLPGTWGQARRPRWMEA